MNTIAYGPRALRCLSTFVVVMLSVVFLAIAGCGGTKVNGTDPTTVPTVAISATPTTIQPGGSTMLTVAASKALTVTVTGSDGSTYSMPATGGTQSVSPKATTTYTATANGTAGQVTATVTITVAAAPPSPAPTVTLSAAPASITAGTNSTLTVGATNATKLVITGTDGSSYNVATTGGTQIVTPATTTTYTATATGAGGLSATTTATVTVTAAPAPVAPTVTLSSNPGTINDGSSATLTVTATNATQVVVTGTDGSNTTLPGAGGTESVSPTATTSYQATASGPGGSATASTIVTVNATHATVTISASPASVTSGNTSTLTVAATGATAVTVTGTDGSSYQLQPTGGTQSVTPKATTTYTATATAATGNVTASATVAVSAPGSLQSVDHVIFMLQENHSFDNYFGMLNPYRKANGYNIGDDGKEYDIDGIDDKLQTISNQTDEGTSYQLFKFASTCIDDVSSSWLESYGDVNRYNFLSSRSILMDGFVHDAEGFAKACTVPGATCSGNFTDTTGQRVMGYYDQGFLNYYYYMASQFAVSNRWFSPVSSKSIPNRIATFTGGTTQGLVYDPGSDDKLPQLNIDNIFARLDTAGVSWRIYYSVTNGLCQNQDDCTGSAAYPATSFSTLSYSYQYLYGNPNHAQCTGTTKPSSVVGDSSNSFCIDPNHIAPIAQYFTDLKNGTLPSFGFIEAGYGNSDEHPGSGQSILTGQAQVAKIVNSLMTSSSWKDSVFFLAYDEGGGPYDHVPPVPGHSNDFSPLFKTAAPDISGIAVNPDSYGPCVPATTPATTHCDLRSDAPGANSGDAAATQGFAAQLGFRVPNIVISPFTRKHYVSNYPMDHTAVIRFVEKRFIGDSAQPLTARDAAQPNLLDFFDFTGTPWATPPTPPAPVTPQTLGYDPCKPSQMQ